MTPTDTLLDHYHAVEKQSRRMLTAARASDWDQVRGDEMACAALIDQLRHKAAIEVLSKEQRLEKGRIMHRILRLDAQVRYLVEPWRAHYEHRFAGYRDRAASSNSTSTSMSASTSQSGVFLTRDGP